MILSTKNIFVIFVRVVMLRGIILHFKTGKRRACLFFPAAKPSGLRKVGVWFAVGVCV